MTTVQLSERESHPDGSFVARVVFDDGVEHDVTVCDPADPRVEQELAWYFEQHLRYPFLDQDRDAVEHIVTYAAFHRLHWEALRDPEVDEPLATRLPVTRRVD